ncbi:MAG TPA: glutamate--tRNA ligase [Coxiellaceae bacterium]|nr:glutamate--tRNA ligase [Coxiellaceae bacterium]
MIRTRFAPSPTGNLHLGSIRTALYSWLYARNRGGEFILRIEDTDQERSTQEATQLIIDSMKWLGLDCDAGPFYQTKRLESYRKAAEQLITEGSAYRCYCSKERLTELREKQLANKEKPKYDGHCRDKNLLADKNQPFVIRFKNNQEGTVDFEDQVMGPLSFQNNELDDLIIVRTDGFPTYNFCVVVDDLDMKITHVIRGADHINNTPRQINIFRAFKTEPPIYSHVPLILGNDGKLLSKRHGAASVLQYKEEGFLPEALLNYLIRLGWSHKDQEIFSRDEMIKLFDVKDINKAAAAFDPEKLRWLNRHYIKALDPKIVATYLEPLMQKLQINYQDGPSLEELVVALRERAETLVEMATKSRYFYEEFEQYQEEAKQHLKPEIAPITQALKQKLENLSDWTDENLHQTIEDIAKQFDIKLGKVAQPIRVAVTGTTVSPPLNVTLRLLGKQRALKRIDAALGYIKQSSS